MKKIVLLGLLSSFLFFSCNGFLNPDSKQDSPAEEEPIQQKEQASYVNILNKSNFPIDLYEYGDRLVCENIAPNANCNITITDRRDEVVYYVQYHIQIETIDIPYKDDAFTVQVSVRKDKVATGIVQNPSRIKNMTDSWLIIENKSSSGLRLYNGSSEKIPENMAEKGSSLNVDEIGVYKIAPSEFGSYAIKRSYSNSVVISFPFTEIAPGKVYKLVVNDSSKCSLESIYSFNCKISYTTDYDTAPNDLTMIIGETLSETQLPELSGNKGYAFDGWYIEDLKAAEGYPIKDDITLTAHWTPIVYTIEYELFEGENNPKNLTSYTVEDIPEDSALLINLYNPTRNNDEFVGWYYEEDFSGEIINNPIMIDIDSLQDIKIYAKWIEICAVQYETLYGTKPDSFLIKKGEKLTSEQLPELSNDDYFFDGWYINESKVSVDEYSITNDVTLTARWTKKCTVQYETKYDTKPNSFIIKKGEKFTSEQLPELTNDEYVFDGWYVGETKIRAGEYIVNDDVTLTARWLKVLTLDAAKITSFPDYTNGVLTIQSNYDKVIFKGESSTVFNNLCIKPSSANTTLVFDNFSFSSSKTTPLIESAFDLSIEYKGNIKLSSTSSGVDSLIKSPGTIGIKGDVKSSLELQPNATTTVDCAIVRASKVIINGGTFIIQGSNGADGTYYGNNGIKGSTGISASKTVIENNAVVTISGGNGGKGSQGKNGESGNLGYQSNTISTNGGPGGDGYDGSTGGAGGNGGDAIYGNVEVESSKIVLSGGNGGTGGNGGSGGDGGTGGRCTAFWSTGGTGGRGGAGGNGGIGGNGGNAVTGDFFVKSGEVVMIGGNGKSGGNGGRGGNGGTGGNCSNCLGAHIGAGGSGSNGGGGGSGGNGGKAVTGSFKQQDASVTSSDGESGSLGGVGNSGYAGSSGTRV